MSEVSVDSRAIIEARKLCLGVEAELKNYISSLSKKMSSIATGWNDQKAKEFEGIINQCIASLKQPLNDLHRCDAYLQRLAQALEEYESISFTSAGASSNASSSSLPSQSISSVATSSLDLDACNNALTRDGRGMQMVNISNVEVEGLSDERFWNHHGRSEEEWQTGMSEYTSMMQSFSNGMSIDQCYESYPNTAGMVFGAQPIQLSDNGQGGLSITNGRHRVAMAQRLGITHLPAIVY